MGSRKAALFICAEGGACGSVLLMRYNGVFVNLVLKTGGGVSACIYFMMGPASLNSILTFPRAVVTPL